MDTTLVKQLLQPQFSAQLLLKGTAGNHCLILTHAEWVIPEIQSNAISLPNHRRLRAKETKEFLGNESLPCLLRNRTRTMLSPVQNKPSEKSPIMLPSQWRASPCWGRERGRKKEKSTEKERMPPTEVYGLLPTHHAHTSFPSFRKNAGLA